MQPPMVQEGWGGDMERAEFWGIGESAEGDEAWLLVSPLYAVLFNHLLELAHFFQDVFCTLTPSNVIEACHYHDLHSVWYVHVVLDPCPRHVSESSSHNGVDIKMNALQRDSMVPHSMQSTVCNHNSPGLCRQNCDRLNKIAHRTPVSLALVCFCLPSQGRGGEVWVSDSVARKQ